MPKNLGDDEDSWPQPPTTRGAGFATVDLMLEAADERELFDRAAVLPQLTRSYDEVYGHFPAARRSADAAALQAREAFLARKQAA